jgi:putative FmdB family regulatory protein
MPIYEYKCLKCGKFEEIQEIDDDELEECPKCGEKVEKLISLGVVGNVLYNNPKEHYNNVIKPEVKEIVDKIKSGDETATADIFGEK